MDTATDISDTALLARYPTLPINHDTKEYWRGCLQKKLLITRCGDCGRYVHFPRPMCPSCWSNKVAPVEVSGKGTVHLFAKFHQAKSATDAQNAPYPMIAVELAEQEGLRMTTTIVNCRAEDIRIGMPVKLTWIDWQGAPVPAFEPA